MRPSPPPAAPPAAAEPVPPWLKSLPLAPEFHPTAAEFADPVAYILKIEPAAAPYGICKVVPPFPPPPKNSTLSNLSRSFAALHPDDPTPSFPTRHQQVGLCPRSARRLGVKPVWRSSRRYTLPEFESKAGTSRKSLLARLNVAASKQLAPLDYEVLFWRAAADRPVVVEYGSDMPGSGFSPRVKTQPPPPPQSRAAAHVGETAWNLRAAARSPGSVLQFMREDVPGVTTPMLYVGMMFSWFAWHVEDHDLHSLNYMHLGAGKTWYGVPRDAALAFEDVVREHGYGGEVNPVGSFATLGQKTTVVSPEVLVESGFNCGEASNIATPEWLRVAKEAAIRRASVNCPPMLSHYQLLYEHALSTRFREPSNETRSSRLKEKKKCEGEQLVKKMFIRNVIEDNELLSHLLNDGSCIIFPAIAHDGPVLSALSSRYQSKMTSRISHDLCSREEAPEALGSLTLSRTGHAGNTHSIQGDKGDTISTTGLLDQGLLSCVTCGIISFSCVAVLKPRDCTARYLMSADSNSINNQLSVSGGSTLADALTNKGNGVISRPYSEQCCNKIKSDDAEIDRKSALDLLAFAYGDQSGPEEDPLKKILKVAHNPDELLRGINESQPNSSSNVGCVGTKLSSSSTECLERPSSQNANCIGSSVISTRPKGVRTRNKYQLKMILSEGFQAKDMHSAKEKKDQSEQSSSKGIVKETVDVSCIENVAGCNSTKISVSEHRGSTKDIYSAKEKKVLSESSSLKGTIKDTVDVSGSENDARCNKTTISVGDHRDSTPTINSLATSIMKPDKDSSRMHVFCLEHAIEVQKQLHAIEYPKIEAEARLLAEEMRVEYDWKDIHFKEANMEDKQKMQEVLQDEEVIPTSSDWAVKLGINLYYSANLAKSPLYNKQMPYNRVISRAFGCNSPNSSPVKFITCERRQTHQKKIAVAGRWCGKVWTSKQVHPYLAHRVESQEVEEEDKIWSYRLDEKHRAEPVGNSSRAEASKRKRSSLTEVTESSNRREEIPGEETNTKKPKHSEEDNLRGLGSAAGVVAPSSAGIALRNSSRIANRARADKLKSKMEEEDGPYNHPKSNIKETSSHASGQKSNIQENANSASHSRARPPKQKTEAEANKQTTPKAPKQAVEYSCDIEGCTMSFRTKRDLSLHKSDICPVKGCGKKFFSHKYLLQHRKVHTDDRPLLCPWEGCNMAFKWPWARTEHLRVHTGDRPYVCHEPGCALTFRFVSDFSRHKRKTGHSGKKKKKKKARS
uniref:JmjC domain-containing protein n=1 Tax=Leersia perrieri TaxID=77586 RepID=A0A0D9V9A0_9ORYZ